MVIGLGYSIFRRKPKRLTGIERVIETASCKRRYALVRVVHTHNDTCRLCKIEHFDFSRAVTVFEDEFCLAALLYVALYVLIYIAVSVSCYRDRACPRRNIGSNTLDHYRRSEYRAVEHCSHSTVGAFPHLSEIVFLYSLRVGRNSRTLDAYSVLFDSVGSLYRYGVLGLFSLDKSEVVVFTPEVYERIYENILYPRPDKSGHFVAVKLYYRRSHLYFFHTFLRKVISPPLLNAQGAEILLFRLYLFRARFASV